MTDLTPARLDELENVLQAHHGKDQAITSAELASAVGIDDSEGNPDTRAAVRRLISERGIPVGSCSNGYYIMESPAELEENLSGIRSRIAGMEDRMQIMVDAFEGYDHGDGGDDAEPHDFECPDCGFSTSEADDMALLSDGTLGCPNCDGPNPDASGEEVTA